MSLSYYLKKALSIPPQELAKKVANKINTKVKDKLQKSSDLSKGTHIRIDVPLINNSYINIKELDISNIDVKVAQYLSQMYCDHRFDLLGSGWVKNSYDSVAFGVEGHQYSMNISVPKSIADDYELIDWQKDYKSGYRWDEKVWYKEQQIGHKLGVDIKVPWELARFQHLPQLAIFSVIDKSLKERSILEFKYQILDFITHNPPRMGVNWVCTMDVAIRAVNMLVAYDLFCQLDVSEILDNHFKQTFSKSIYEHGLHIVNNLEYTDWLTTNHYLSNIAGLVFIASYLHNDPEINRWLAFGIQELISETEKQFYKDGGNFESSTCYHRLSAEMVLYSSALILELKKEKLADLNSYTSEKWKIYPRLLAADQQNFTIDPTTNMFKFPQSYIDLLFKIGRFTVDITKPDGEVPQFGDNDSGRFLRLTPIGKFITYQEASKQYLNLCDHRMIDKLFWDENTLNHTTLCSSFAGLFEETIFQNFDGLEKSFITSITSQKLLSKNMEHTIPSIIKKQDLILPFSEMKTYTSSIDIKNLQSFFYPDSGIYIFKNPHFYLAVCATPLGQNENGGHTHNDKLGYELQINGQNIVRDPGTYLYTPLPSKRNEFRSGFAHSIPIVGKLEQNIYDSNTGLFSLQKQSECQILAIDSQHLSLLLRFHDVIQLREFSIKQEEVKITDSCNHEFEYHEFGFYSNGYGKVEKI